MTSAAAGGVVIVGAGPAGLMAAERLVGAGHRVTVVDRMPTAGRKFLMAGRGGLNLTNTEPPEDFVRQYGAAEARIAASLARFSADDLRRWAEHLGQPTFVGSSGRVFPTALKASPLLRAWLARLGAAGVDFRFRHRWLGWNGDGSLRIAGPDGAVAAVVPAATLLALGGASWPRLGSDGDWVRHLAARGIGVAPLRPANCGFELPWTPYFTARHAGQPLKTVALGFHDRRVRGDVMVTRYGLEGGALYPLSAGLRDAIEATGTAILTVDLRPDVTTTELANRLAGARNGQSLATLLRKRLSLAAVGVALLREAFGPDLDADPAGLARRVKAVPLTLTAARPLDRAISTAGGVRWDEVTDGLMLKAAPGVFVAGEMLDWEAPTGGYLLQACFATGVTAAEGIARFLSDGRAVPTPLP